MKKTRRQNDKRRLGYALSLMLTGLMLFWLVIGTANVSRSSVEKQTMQLNKTIHRYATQCYALEGRFPDSLEYLERQYGLRLDRLHYVYHYRYLGTNMQPEIAVFALDEQ